MPSNQYKIMMFRLLYFFRKEKLFTILLLLFTILLFGARDILTKSLLSFDLKSMIVLVSVMMASRGLVLSGIGNVFLRKIVLKGNVVSSRKIFMFLLITAFSSMFMMNDGSIFVFVPIAVLLSNTLGLESGVIVVLTIMACNIGSVLSPVGNPQNILIWNYYDISLSNFVKYELPLFVIGLFLLWLFNYLLNRKMLVTSNVLPRIKIKKLLAFASIVLIMLDIILIETGYWFIILPLMLVILFFVEREILFGFDYVLIGIFVLMFIVFRAFSFLFLSFNEALNNWYTVFFSGLVVSQLISNVPATLSLLGVVKGVFWKQLLWGVNLGGLGVFHSSFANIIGLRLSGVNLKIYHRIAMPLFIVYTVLSFIFLYYMRCFFLVVSNSS